MITKFGIGDTIYYVSQKKETASCGMCGGEKKLMLLNGTEIDCPTCHGTGVVYTNRIIPGDTQSFEVNFIQIVKDNLFYASIDEGGNVIHSCIEAAGFETALEAEDNAFGIMAEVTESAQ